MEGIVELVQELVKAKDKDTKVYIKGLIDARLEEYVKTFKRYQDLDNRIKRLESAVSFQASSRGAVPR